MGMDSRDEMDKSMLSAEARQKFDELVALLSEERYGPEGPPITQPVLSYPWYRKLGHLTPLHRCPIQHPQTPPERTHFCALTTQATIGASNGISARFVQRQGFR